MLGSEFQESEEQFFEAENNKEASEPEHLDPLKEGSRFIMHEVNLVGLIPILEEGIVSRRQAELLQKDQKVKRFLPGGEGLYAQDEMAYNVRNDYGRPGDLYHNDNAYDLISVYDQSQMKPEYWKIELLEPGHIHFIINPDLPLSPGKGLWRGEAFIKTQIKTEDLEAIVISENLCEMTIGQYVKDLFYGHFGFDGKNHDEFAKYSFENLFWAIRAIVLERPSVKDNPNLPSEMNWGDADHAFSWFTGGETELEDLNSILKQTREATYRIQYQISLAEDKAEAEKLEQELRPEIDRIIRAMTKVINLFLNNYTATEVKDRKLEDLIVYLGQRNNLTVFKSVRDGEELDSGHLDCLYEKQAIVKDLQV